MFTNGAFHNIGLGPRNYLSAGDLGRYAGIDWVQENPFNGAGTYSDDPDFGAHKLNYLAQGDEHLGAFKVPSLRNVANTAPYMHGGHFETLTDVVEYYSDLDETPSMGHREESLLPLELSDAQIADLVAFLDALSGSPLDASLLEQPASPVLGGR
jgi:cytochrome c peroxidase